MEKLHIAVAPHKYLPPEILAEVFLYCLHHDPLDGRLRISDFPPHPLLAPWVLSHVCSRWRWIALGEKRLWNSIYYEGNSWRHTLLLEEAFKHSGQSMLQLEARESGNMLYKSFLREVVLLQSHRITSLVLDVAIATLKNFLLLPSGLFDELECVKIQIRRNRGHISMPPATVFQGAPHLRHVTIPLYNQSPLDLTLPWDQLTYLALIPGPIELTDSLEVLSLCTSLSEYHLCPCPDGQSPIQVFPPASIQLPHLRKLGLKAMSWRPLYADFFRPLVIPKLEQFAFVLSGPFEDYLKELRETIDRLSIPDVRLELVLHYVGRDGGDIVRLARSLPPLTSIKAYDCYLPASTIELIAQDVCFQALTSLEVLTGAENLVEMFKAHWVRARQSNNMHMGIRSATIEVIDASAKDISELSRDIAMIQKQLGIIGAKITLQRF